MEQQELSLDRQLKEITKLVAICSDKRTARERLRRMQAEVDVSLSGKLQEAEKSFQLGLARELQQIEEQAERDAETLRADCESRRTSLVASHDRGVQSILAESEAAIAECEEKRKSELWMLQSVMDEDGEDNPTSQFEREYETFATQRTFLDDRVRALDTQVDAAAGFLEACHTSADREIPPPTLSVRKRLQLRDAAVESGDAALSEIEAMVGLHTPHWVKGMRPWAFGILTFVVVWIGVVAIRADLRDFLNADLGNPDWEWAGVSALIAVSIVVLQSFILLYVVQGMLRSRYERILMHVELARSARRLWEEKSERYLDKLESEAEEWRRELERNRLAQADQINQSVNAKVEETQRRTNEQLETRARELEEQLRQLDAESISAEEQIQSRCRDACAQRRMFLTAAFEQDRISRTAASEQRRDLLKAEYTRNQAEWAAAVEQVRRISQSATGDAAAMMKWPKAGSDWALPEEMPTCLSVGDILATVPCPPANDADETPSNLCVEMPGVLQFPGDMAIVVEHDSAGREAALGFLRTQILRLLTVIPAGRIRLTLIDPIGLGQSFSAMMHLADFDELLIQTRIWTDSSQIRDQLQKITIHMENIFQTYLRSQFNSIEEYNASAGEVAEPYHFVVVAGFPAAFTDESARHLSSILTSGPRCGVHALVAWNPAIGAPPGFDCEELRTECQSLCVRNGEVQPVIQTDKSIVFEPAKEPPAADYVSLVRDVGEQSRDARRVEVAFSRISPQETEIWAGSTSEGIDLPIGRAGAARLQFMRLGRGTSQHVLVAGKTGSGKSTFLHILITNLSLHYGPDQIQFYLIDFKKGVEFRTYAANRLPHARVVAIESDREFGLSVLERLDEILQERGDLFRERGIQDIPGFRKAYPDEPMPRLLLLIDEFQEFFVAEDRVSARASLLLDRLVRQGRAFGIHVLLGSQTLGGAYSLARSTMGQIAVRIALQCSENDAHLILSEDNSAARLLTRPGEAIYNDANGLSDGNSQFQIAWLDDDQREKLIGKMPRTTGRELGVDNGMIVFEGNVPPTAELCGPLNAFLKSEQDATRRPHDAAMIWLGEPVAIAAPTCIPLRRASGQNLLIVGQDELQVDSLIAYAILSFSLQTGETVDARGRQEVMMLHDGRDPESFQRFEDLNGQLGRSSVRILGSADCDGCISGLYDEVIRREESGDSADAPEQLLIVRNLGQYRSLRKEDDDFGLGGFGEPKAQTPATMFSDLLKRGPLVGVHVLVWSDSFNNAVRWLSSSLLREFENRIAFRMNQTDSASLVDSPVASTLVPGRALLYRDQTGSTEKFRPFAWPGRAWLDSIVHSDDATAAGGMDIDTFTIE